MDKVTVEHSKEEQLIIYLKKGFFESNSKFEYRVQKALFWRDNDYYTENGKTELHRVEIS